MGIKGAASSGRGEVTFHGNNICIGGRPCQESAHSGVKVTDDIAECWVLTKKTGLRHFGGQDYTNV